MEKLVTVSAKIPEEVYKEMALRIPEGKRSSFIRDAVIEKLQKTPRPDKIFAFEQRISKLEEELSEIKRHLVELGMLTYEHSKINPHAFCTDEIDHKIVDHLLHYKGATTTELADHLGTNRWHILNRLRRIKEVSKKELGKSIVKYYPSKRAGKMRAWWISEEIIET
ncbi:MAG: hypothetical protein U9O89_02340 [Thermoproteota archaeon]|nr:hypothetical protein [Thermoproteota archaeon]